MAVPIIPDAGLVTFGTTDSVFGSYTATGTVTSATVTLAPGWWGVLTGAHNTAQYVVNSGTTTVTAVAASGFGHVYSDGNSAIIVNDSTGGTAAHYFQILGGGP